MHKIIFINIIRSDANSAKAPSARRFEYEVFEGVLRASVITVALDANEEYRSLSTNNDGQFALSNFQLIKTICGLSNLQIQVINFDERSRVTIIKMCEAHPITRRSELQFNQDNPQIVVLRRKENPIRATLIKTICSVSYFANPIQILFINQSFPQKVFFQNKTLINLISFTKT